MQIYFGGLQYHLSITTHVAYFNALQCIHINARGDGGKYGKTHSLKVAGGAVSGVLA